MSKEIETIDEEKPKNPGDLIARARDRFLKICEADPTGILFEKESMFAYQALTKSDFAKRTAMANPNSVINAVINIASVGLSLNPATSYAYLVPRDGAICLDISYQGLIKIATDSGSIKWARADLVYSTDRFTYHGPAAMPDIVADPFAKERGDIVGVYCVAKTNDGDILCEAMAIDEILRIRAEASSVKHAKNEAARNQSPWYRYFGEMAKKAVIKRASKTWPKSEQHERIQKAIEVINETEGSDWEPFTAEDKARFDALVKAEDGAGLILMAIEDEDKYEKLLRAAKAEIPRGGKMQWQADNKAIVEEVRERVTNVMLDIIDAMSEQDESAVRGMYEDLTEDEQKILKHYMTVRGHSGQNMILTEQLEQILEAAA